MGVRRRARGLTVITARGDDDGPSRVGIVADRGVGGAVARNRAKRRLREAAARSGVPDGVDCVLVATPAVLKEDFGTVVDWVRHGFQAANEGDRR